MRSGMQDPGTGPPQAREAGLDGMAAADMPEHEGRGSTAMRRKGDRILMVALGFASLLALASSI